MHAVYSCLIGKVLSSLPQAKLTALGTTSVIIGTIMVFSTDTNTEESVNTLSGSFYLIHKTSITDPDKILDGFDSQH